MVFRPAGVLANEVLADDGQTKLHRSWAWAYKEAADTVARWDSATVEAEADNWATAEALIAEAMAVLRFLLREIVTVNVDIHRIGLVGEVDLAVRDHVAVFDDGRVAPGACVVDAPVEVRFSDEQLDKWDTDDRVKWLSAALAAAADDRSLSEQRALTAIKVLDRAFLTQEPTVRIVLYAVALEVLFSNSEDTTSGSGKTSTLEIARRVAFLTCGQGCATTGPACPYVRGFKSQKDLGTTADQIAAKGYEWRCSAFLDVARPSDMEPLFMRPSLFGARNQAVHEGRTTLDRSDMRWIRLCSERAVRAFLEWVAAKPLRTVTDLDAEILAGLRCGVFVAEGPERPPSPGSGRWSVS